MTVQRYIVYFTWIVPTALQVIIVAILTGRKLYRDFPVFLCYTIFQIINSLTCLALALHPAASYSLYFYVSWLGKIIEVSLSFAVIYEIFSHVFYSYEASVVTVRVVSSNPPHVGGSDGCLRRRQ